MRITLTMAFANAAVKKLILPLDGKSATLELKNKTYIMNKHNVWIPKLHTLTKETNKQNIMVSLENWLYVLEPDWN